MPTQALTLAAASYRRVAWLALSLLLIWSPLVHGYFGELRITPSAPVAGENVQLLIDAGECDLILSNVPIALDISEGAIDVVLRGVIDSAVYCWYPDHTARVDLGALQGGTYAVRLTIHDTGNFQTPEIYRHGTFTVSARNEPPRVIPTSRPATLWILAAMVVGFAAVAIAVRSRG